MHKDLGTFCESLDALAASVLSGWNGDQTFCEAWGWNCPTVTRHDMAAVASRLAEDIRAVSPDSLDPKLQELVQDFPRRIQHMKAQTLPQFWGGNSGPATAAYQTTLSSMRLALVPLLGWQVIPDPKAMPAHMARRLRAIQAELDQMMPNKEALEGQLEQIKEAHAAAESLPLDLQALSEARERVIRLANETASSAEKTNTNATSSAKALESITLANDAAGKLVAQCEDAYRITTTKGLAAAFDQRAEQLGQSLFTWVFGLIGALVVGSWLGSTRVELLSKAISTQDPQWSVIWMHLVLSALSIGAPIWFAWIATKQIGQRFRLAEDYAFKASVAKAYEGYRKEAARLDPTFEARLFSSALTRLDEAPLRLVEQATHGSPWHEFFSSPQFQSALDTVPDFRDKFIEIAKQGASAIRLNLPQQPSKPSDTA